MTCTHEWITVSEYSRLVGDDVDVIQCAQCGANDTGEDPVWDDSEFDYDEWLRGI